MSGIAALLVSTAACDRGPEKLGDRAANQVEPKQVAAEGLKAAASDPRVKAFYEARGWKAAWNEDQAKQLTEALRDAPRHGLEAIQFLKEGDEAGDPASREAALSLAAVSYADALANGQVDPIKLAHPDPYELAAPRVDIIAGLNNAVAEGSVGDWLNGLAPQDEEYRALSESFLRYSQAAKGQAPNVPPGGSIEPGRQDKRIPMIAQALRLNGYLKGEAPAQASATYTPDLVEAVKSLQRDYGLEDDGVIGNATLNVLNAGPGDRARTLAINLERRRWLARQVPATRIDVNTAAAFLNYYKDGKSRDRRVVVVGQPEWETPQLGSPIVRLVANPPWNVPESIEKDELAGKSAAYLAKQGFTRKDGRLVQAAGPDSALGLVKFDMVNDHAIYLHDTPAKTLFGEADRHRSHGCVRVHNAVQFARLLADDQGKRAEFDQAMASKENHPITLNQQVPVRLLYHTAFLDGDRIVFRPDVYGWDERVAQGLGLTARSGGKRVIRTHAPISGP